MDATLALVYFILALTMSLVGGGMLVIIWVLFVLFAGQTSDQNFLFFVILLVYWVTKEVMRPWLLAREK